MVYPPDSIPPVTTPMVMREGRKTRTVKNLGWLLGNIWQTERVGVYQARHTDHGFPNGYVLVVWTSDGTVYATPFADAGVAHQWLTRRRLLRGKPLDWFGITTTI